MFAGNGSSRAENENERRFEKESASFHERVRNGYLELASTEPGWVVVDGSGDLPEVSAAVDAALAEIVTAG